MTDKTSLCKDAVFLTREWDSQSNGDFECYLIVLAKVTDAITAWLGLDSESRGAPLKDCRSMATKISENIYPSTERKKSGVLTREFGVDKSSLHINFYVCTLFQIWETEAFTAPSRYLAWRRIFQRLLPKWIQWLCRLGMENAFQVFKGMWSPVYYTNLDLGS